MEPWQEASAMVQFARDSVRGLSQIESQHDIEMAKRVVRALVEDEDVEMLDVFKRILYCPKREELCVWYRETYFDTERWLQLMSQAAKLPAAWWEELDLNDIATLLGDDDTLRHLLIKCKDVVRNPDHPLSRLDYNSAWASAVRYYIANRDYQRACDILNQGRKGLFDKGYSHLIEECENAKERIEVYADPNYRIHRLKLGVLRELVEELHGSMELAGILGPVEEPAVPTSISYTEGDAVYGFVCDVAGVSHGYAVHNVSSTALKALRLARHFYEKRLERRRKNRRKRARDAKAPRQTTY